MSIWTSLVDESSLISSLEATGRLATTQVGTSANGTPILLWRIGGDSGPPALADRAAILHIGLQHGDEPAGREALLAFADYLCNTVTAETSFLDDHGVLMIPTANPDGFPSSRFNGDGDDVNRFHRTLHGAPETAAIATALVAARPMLVVDHHEFGPGFTTEDLLFAEPRHAATSPHLTDASDALISVLEDRADSESWTHAPYPAPGSPSRQTLVGVAGLRHSSGVLIETRETADDDPGQQARTDMHYAMAEEVLAHVIAEHDALRLAADTVSTLSPPFRAGWIPITEGSHSGSSPFTVDLTQGGRYPPGTFSAIRVRARGSLVGAPGHVTMRVNNDYSVPMHESARIRDVVSDGSTVDSDLTAATVWRIAYWGTLAGRSNLSCTIHGTDTTGLLSFESESGQLGSTAATSCIGRFRGVLTQPRLLDSLRLWTTDAQSDFGAFDYQIEGYVSSS